MADKKVALITGANKGIGKEIARQLGAQGYTVLLGARDAGRGAEAAEDLKKDGIDAHTIQLEVTNQESLDAAAAKVEAEYGKLDVLVNNAGIYIESAPASQTDVETFKKTYDTNVFGVFAATKSFLPLIKKAEAGRIVNMSSGLGSITQNSDPNWSFAAFKAVAYNSSKSAVNAITVVFAAELKDTPIKVNAADPGYVATDINGNSGPRTVQQGATAAVRLATLPADGPTGGYFDEDGTVPW
ncbi:dehydrogenase [Capsulimonas corticalis]|uniref:Dehydrogenase n=1 Tax=Capsulimonas corticalis TaxID=2219043 RepID=A0A402D197_9BACT|nr:SDR family oxidoreductase [Capsulimonas corticalis]BDI31672.1 dehydrogenase [Capsulimonas corticalis]